MNCGKAPIKMVLMVGLIDQKHLEGMANDEGFIFHLQRVSNDIDTYIQDKENTWFASKYGITSEIKID